MPLATSVLTIYIVKFSLGPAQAEIRQSENFTMYVVKTEVARGTPKIYQIKKSFGPFQTNPQANA